MRRRRDLLAALAACALCLPGCANTQQAIAPATVDDLMLGIAADIDSWFSLLFILIGV